MNKPKNYDTVEAKQGGVFERMQAGGYVLKVINAIEGVSKNTNRPMLELLLDVAEGQFKDHYKQLCDKFGGIKYLRHFVMTDEEGAANLKGVLNAFELSNKTFIFNWDDPKCLIGKKIGANLRDEEYMSKEKELKTILKIAYLAPVWEVQEMKVLPIKKLDNSKQFNEAVESVNEEKKDDLPF